MGDQVGQTITEADASSAPAPAQSMHSEDLVSTVPGDFGLEAMDAGADPEGANNTEGQEADAAEAKKQESEEADDTRFDRHPRFVELNTRLKAAEERNRNLETRLDEISRAPKKEAGTEELPFKDTSKMSDDELLDWQSEDPKGFWENMNKQQEYNTQKAIEAALARNREESDQKTIETKVEATFEAYAKDNPDFDEMWDSGQIQKYMDANPGHNAISAHMALTQEKRQEAAIDAAVKKALAEADTQRRSTRAAARVMPAAPSSAPSTPGKADDELKDPNKYGGTTAVLARRLARRRAQAGMG